MSVSAVHERDTFINSLVYLSVVNILQVLTHSSEYSLFFMHIYTESGGERERERERERRTHARTHTTQHAQHAHVHT
jgi:hypothetical protein